MLPAARQDVSNPWKDFADAKASYDRIIPYRTDIAAVRQLGFSPYQSANVQVLNEAQVVNAVLPSPLKEKTTIPSGIKDCMQHQDACSGYLMEPSHITQERVGNFFLDFLNFRRKTLTSGWKFSALIVVIDDMVVYKQWSGEPRMESVDLRTNPLGPLQSMGETLKVPP
jgi:hypothetical protein